jgi:hypothetical protein
VVQHTGNGRRERRRIDDVEVAGRVVAADDDRLDDPQVDEGGHLPHPGAHHRADADRAKRHRPQLQRRHSNSAAEKSLPWRSISTRR